MDMHPRGRFRFLPPARSAVRPSLVLGVAALVSGCIAGLEAPGERVLFLTLLGGSIVLFAAAAVVQWKRPHDPGVEPAAIPPVEAGSSMAQARVVPAPTSPPAADVLADHPLLMPDRAQSPVVAGASPSPDVGSTLAAVSPDIPALMRLPLSDLLLAALCKDPQGVRRIFAELDLREAAGAGAGPHPAKAADLSVPR